MDKPKKFTEIYFDNYIKTALCLSVIILLYIVSAHFGVEIYVIGGAILSAVLALILTFVELIRRKKVAPPV